jgi:hypothetical protein
MSITRVCIEDSPAFLSFLYQLLQDLFRSVERADLVITNNPPSINDTGYRDGRDPEMLCNGRFRINKDSIGEAIFFNPLYRPIG